MPETTCLVPGIAVSSIDWNTGAPHHIWCPDRKDQVRTMSRTGRQFRRSEDTQREGGDTNGNTSANNRWAGKPRHGSGRPQPVEPRRQEVKRHLQGLRGTNLAAYLDEAEELD